MDFLTTDRYNQDFRIWLEQLKLTGCIYEIVVEHGKITKVYVKIPDDGNWKTIKHGRIIGSKVVSYIQRVYLPRLVDGKFIYDYNGESERYSKQPEPTNAK